MRTVLRRLGSLPSVAAVGGFYALAAVAGLAVPDPARGWTMLALIALFGLHCWLRPTRSLSVFLLAFAPGPVGNTVGLLTDAPSWIVGVPLLLLVLVVLAVEDRAERTGRVAAPTPRLRWPKRVPRGL